MSADPDQFRRCGVIGSPVAHSLSPVLHRAAYRSMGLDWGYDAHDITVHTLQAFLTGLDQRWRGLSVTMPLKVAAAGHSVAVDEPGSVVGVVNTLLHRDDGQWEAANTDVAGFVAALAEAGVSEVTDATVLGAGATAASAVYALHRLGADVVHVLARSPVRAHPLLAMADRIGIDVRLQTLGADALVPPTDVVVSTIPAEAQTPLAESVVRAGATIFEVTYDPAETPLLRAARHADVTAVPGFHLLLHQAARQVELMTGCRPAPLESMRAAGEAELADRARRGT